MDLSSWIRRFVEGGVGEREVAMLEPMNNDTDSYVTRDMVDGELLSEIALNLGCFYGHVIKSPFNFKIGGRRRRRHCQNKCFIRASGNPL